MTKKSALDPSAKQYSQTKGQQHTAAKLIASPHIKHPLQEIMQGVLSNILISAPAARQQAPSQQWEHKPPCHSLRLPRRQ